MDSGSIEVFQKADVDLVWDVLFSSGFFLDIEVLYKLVFLNPEFNYRVEGVSRKLCEKHNIEVRPTFALSLKHISRRVVTSWTILYRSADWTLQEAIRDQNEAVMKQVMRLRGS